ncbi:anti-sigma factor antagonist [Micromonospora zingiberis]|uniref:Anti-sigma factor antagonist n=1 Tax=Micromonospora zingiberis TaxID=2053011 RepID=A0A4R0GSC6_9ACTN|nr:STAS domain-containing protein [Micromonospora zingiberis]TCC00561.1 anti-sigma factor antagonist [Micromonospora zingiberis]
MTVVPDDNLMTLICDVCGETTTGTACVLPDAEVVWTLVSDHGWSGSPFATGPHRCPRCSTLPPGTTPGGGDRTGGPGAGLPAGQGDEVAVLASGGDLGADAGEALRAALRDAVALAGTVVVDLVHVQVIDSVGLGLLVRAHREVRERGERLCLAAPSRFIRTVLHTMKLDGVFPIFASRDEALAQLRAEAPTAGDVVLVDVTPAEASRPRSLAPRQASAARRPVTRVTV